MGLFASTLTVAMAVSEQPRIVSPSAFVDPVRRVPKSDGYDEKPEPVIYDESGVRQHKASTHVVPVKVKISPSATLETDDARRLRIKIRIQEEHREERRVLHKKALVKSQDISNACETRTVFNVGLPRTGTTSVSEFMETLGYHSHHIVPYTLEEVDACKNMTSNCGFYEELGAGSPTELTAFEDHPTFGLACSLVTKFKNAKFIHVTRSFEAYSESVHHMLCAYIRPDCAHASWAEYLVVQATMYGKRDILVNFCSAADHRPNMCHDLGRSTKAKLEWEASGLKEQWRGVHSEHEDKVRNCVPPARRLHISLGAGGNAKAIHNFLGCKGEAPEFPAYNSAHHPAL